MPSPTQSELRRSIAKVLRDADAALTTDEVVARLPRALQGCTTREFQNAVSTHPLCISTQRGQYIYLPTALRGAEVFLPRQPGDEGCWLDLPGEAFALLWPERHTNVQAPGLLRQVRRPAEVVLPSGLSATWDRRQSHSSWQEPLEPGEGDEGGFVLRCIDAEVGRYTLSQAPSVGSVRLAELDQVWHARTLALMQAGRYYDPDMLALKLLAGGVYHGNTPQKTLLELLSQYPFFWEGSSRVACRPDVPESIRRLFPGRTRPMSRWLEETPALPPPAIANCRYLLRASIGRFRVDLEASAEDSLSDLHWALQEALMWDGDHGHAFYLTGKRTDGDLAVPCPELASGELNSDEVTLGHFDPQPGDKILYRFDFGDDWQILIKVLGRTPGVRVSASPSIVGTSGKPPEQYPRHSGEEDDDLE